MSIMYKMNSKGPNTEPCGTPHITFKSLEFSLIIWKKEGGKKERMKERKKKTRKEAKESS